MGLPAAADRGADRLTDRVIAPTLFRPYRPCARRAPMVTRKKNLLEVLRPTAAHAPRPSSSPGSEVPIGAFAARARPRLALSNKKTVQLALVFVVAVGGAYWLGRQHSPGVAAASSAADEGLVPGALLRPSQTAAPAAPPVDVAAANMQSAQSGSADDKAFLLDLTNRYTIRLIQYSDDAAGKSTANALYEHLRKKEAVPVISPIHKGKAMILVAGLAPKVKDLDRLLAHVRGLRGPNSQDPSLPFKDAYVVNIDDLVERPR